ncbi:MAG: hypothetical protein K6A05_08550 [Lachnospiraceae bacterium]|nr:hypothetical protein [Lachnospiraceae bacterium]
MKQHKPSEAFYILLVIPIQCVLDVVIFWGCAYLDTVVIPDPNALGHPAPATMILAFMLLPPITIIVCVVSVIITIILYNKYLRDSKNPPPKPNTPPML